MVGAAATDPPAFRRRMVELGHAGRSPVSLAGEILNMGPPPHAAGATAGVLRPAPEELQDVAGRARGYPLAPRLAMAAQEEPPQARRALICQRIGSTGAAPRGLEGLESPGRAGARARAGPRARNEDTVDLSVR